MSNCNFAKAVNTMTSRFEDFQIAHEVFEEYHEKEDLRLGEAAFVRNDKAVDLGDEADRLMAAEETRRLMEENSGDGTISWSVNGKGSLTAKIKSLTLRPDGMWRLATDKGVAIFKEGVVQSESREGKFYVVPAMMFTDEKTRRQMRGEFGSRKLVEGDPIKLFAQVSMVDGSHVTLNFNPESKFSEGPRIPEEFNKGVKVVKVGEFANENMKYDVVKLEVDGKVYMTQPDGTPYHITRYVNTEKGVKPFMAGQHARSGAYEMVEEEELPSLGVETIEGTYKEDFDRSGYMFRQGTKYAHVTDINTIDRLAAAGDEVKGGKASWLGTHIGTYDVVKDYGHQRFDKGDRYVYEVELAKNLNALMLPDTRDGDWNADNMTDMLEVVHPEIEWSKDMSKEEVRAKLLELGYDAIAYANTDEGRLSGKADSIIVLNPSAVVINGVSPSLKGELFDSYMDTLGVIHGNTNKAKNSNWSNLNKQDDYKIGDTKSMLDMLDNVRGMSENKASDKVYEDLKGLLKSMKPEFFEKMNLFLKKTAGESAGLTSIGKNSIKLAISKSRNVISNGQTDEEIYVHEVVHAMVMFALRSGSPEVDKIKRSMYGMMAKMRKETDWKMFLDKDESLNKELEEIRAKETWDYVFNSENSLDEFIVHVLTNPYMKKKAELLKLSERKNDTVLEKIVGFFKTLVDVVLGKYEFGERNKSVYDRVYDLSFALADINNTANRKVAEASFLKSGMELINDLDDAVYSKLHKFSQKYFEDDSKLEPLVKNATKIDKLAYWMKFSAKAMVNPHYAEAMGLVASSFGLSAKSSIRGWIKDFKDTDSATQLVQWFAMASSKIDGARMSNILAAKKNVLDRFSRKLTEDEEKALTRVVIDTDMADLIKDSSWDNKKLRELLVDEEKLKSRLDRAIHDLAEADKSREHWNVNQAVGLGYYMATGETNIAQNTNARNIAIGYGSGKYNKANKDVVNAINLVATLTALKHTDRKHKLYVAELMKNESKGVWNLMHLYNGAKKQSDELLFDKSTHKVKGYSKEIFDEGIVSRVAKVREREAIEAEGYTYVGPVQNHKEVDSNEEMGLFISDKMAQSDWLTAGTRMTGFGRKGTTISEIKYNEGSKFSKAEADLAIEKLHIRRREVAKKMESGKYMPSKEDMGLMPVLDEDGHVVDYRYVMSKKNKEELMQQNIKVSEVIGRTFGSIVDKAESKKHNAKVLELILSEMKEKWDGGMLGKGASLQEWTKIGPKVADPEMRELYSILPKEFQMAAQARQDKVLAVPTELLHLYFGYRHMSIGNAGPIKKWLPRQMRALLVLAESMWQEIVKTVKSDILIKMPIVLISNIVSNFIYGVMTGTDPVTLIKMYYNGFRDIRAYITRHRELQDLKVKRAAIKETDVNGLKKINEEINAIVKELEDSSVHELYELGMYTAIVEDVEKAALRGNNKIKKYLDKKIENLWSPVRTGLQWAYLSEETAYYKVNQEILTMSDLLARHVQNQKGKLLEQEIVNGKRDLPVWWLDENKGSKRKRLTGKEKDKFLKESKVRRHYGLLRDYIPYNDPNGKGEEYLNRMGAVMFTKYVKRIQRVIADSSIKHPVKSFLTLMGQQFLFDAPTIQDQAWLSKDWYSQGFGLGNIVPLHSPWDLLKTGLEPHGITYTLNPASMLH